MDDGGEEGAHSIFYVLSRRSKKYDEMTPELQRNYDQLCEGKRPKGSRKLWKFLSVLRAVNIVAYEVNSTQPCPQSTDNPGRRARSPVESPLCYPFHLSVLFGFLFSFIIDFSFIISRVSDFLLTCVLIFSGIPTGWFATVSSSGTRASVKMFSQSDTGRATLTWRESCPAWVVAARLVHEAAFENQLDPGLSERMHLRTRRNAGTGGTFCGISFST